MPNYEKLESTGDRRRETGDVRQEASWYKRLDTRDRKHKTGDVRQET